MKSITIKEPTIWKIAEEIELLKDRFSDIKEAIDVYGKILMDMGESLESAGKMFEFHNKAIKALEQKWKKK